MNSDPFAPMSKTKSRVYFAIVSLVIIAGAVILGAVGNPVERMLLWAAGMVGIVAVVVGSALWICGGRRSDQEVGPARLRLPIRVIKAWPWIIGLLIVIQVVKLLEVLSSR